MEMTLHRASRYTLTLALLALPAAAGAQAFGLNEIGSCALARGFAATASPCDDASSIYWNPGAMPRARGWTLSAGVSAIAVDGDFIQDTTLATYKGNVPTEYVPSVFVNYRGAGKLAYGFGVYVPYGLTSEWGDDFPGRFAAKRASLQSIYVQPNITYQITPNWSIGGGPVFGHSTVELVQGVDLSTVPTSAAGPTFGQLGVPKRTEFARATLKGSANAFGVDLGLHGRITPAWEVGLRFLSQLTFKYDDADATFVQVPTGQVTVTPAGSPFPAPAGTSFDALVASQFTTGALQTQKVATQIQHPAQIQAGFAYTGFANTTLSAEYSYVGWKSFKQLPVDFTGATATTTATDKVLIENYNNTSSIRLGADRRLSNGIALRAGFAAATAAAPPETVTPLLPEQDRSLAMFGVGLPFASRFALDATYARIFTPGRRGRLDERSSTSTPQQAIALNEGSYALSANIFAISLKATY
jgi:long-chain fatty acid transport protein